MAFIRNTDKFVEGLSNKFFTDGRAQLALQPTVTSLESEDSGMKLRLDVIEGGAGVEGSIAKAQADAQSYADQQIAALVNSAPEVLDTLKELSDAIGGDASFASTVAGQIGAVDAKIDQEVLDRQAAISGLESSVGADVSALESADAALSLRLDELELDPVTKSYVDSQDSSESSARQSADTALSGRLNILEQDPTTKTYVDGEVSSLQGQITQEISDRQSGDSALSGRLDIIEGAGEGSVAKAEQDAKDYADGLDSAMDARMLVLEADPVTKVYVDAADLVLDNKIGLDLFATSETEGFSVAQSLINEINNTPAMMFGEGEFATIEELVIKTTDGQAPTVTNIDQVNSYLKLAGDPKEYVLLNQPYGSLVHMTSSNGEFFAGGFTETDTFQLSLSFGENQNTVMDVAFLYDSVSLFTMEGFKEIQKQEGYLFLTESQASVSASSIGEVLQQEISDRQAAVSAEESARIAADSALSGRLDVLEADPVAKAYVDSADSSLQSQITQEIADRQADVDAEEQRAIAAEGLLSGRLDTLELDPVTKTYVDGEVSDLQGQITQEISDRAAAVSSEESARQAADSALSGRLDVLEVDPVEKAYVDSADSGLQSQIDTEKGRIDAILLSADADKDSFAEIVNLINSVDTENDSAFASYVLSNDAALAQEVSDRQSGDSALSGRLDVIEGADSVEGSVAKAEKDAKDYTDSEIDSFGGTMVSYLTGEVASDVTTLVNDNRNYVMGELSSTQTILQQNIDQVQELSNDADSGLSGRLDVLEADPTTKSYVDGEVASLQAEDLTLLKLDGSRNMSGSLKFSSGDIGQTTGNRPNNMYANTAVTVNYGGNASTATDSYGRMLNVRSEHFAKNTQANMYLGRFNYDGSSYSAIQSGNALGEFSFYGNVNGTNSATVICAGVTARAIENYSTSGKGTALEFKAAPAGETALRIAFEVRGHEVRMNRGQKVKMASQSSDYTLVEEDYVVAISDLTAVRTITLPSASAMGSGKVYVIKDITGAASSSNYIHIVPQSGETIDGASEFDLQIPYESIMVISDGTNWFVL